MAEVKAGPRGVLEVLLNRVVDSRDFRKLRIRGFRERRAMATALIQDASDAFALARGDGTKGLSAYMADDESDTPILDWIRDMLESGTLQDFLTFLLDWLPKIIAAIMAIFV